MFYQGPLRDGISAAVEQQKCVFCFVTDDNEESKTWENEYLKDAAIDALLTKHAVALKLTAGSEEAKYLAEIFPIPKTPTIVIIKNGELKEYVTAGTTRDDLLRRVQSAFNIPADPPSPQRQQPPPPEATRRNEPARGGEGEGEQPPTAVSSSSSSTVPVSAPASTVGNTASQQPESVRRAFAERRARLQAQREESERKAKEERARAKGKDKAGTNGDDADTGTRKQAEILKKRRQREQEERKRILQKIEDDKEERRIRAAAQREAKQSVDGSSGNSEKAGDVVNAAPAAGALSSTARASSMTSLQVRLLDGSTMRSRFDTATSTLRDARKWVDENRTDPSSGSSGRGPYRFKQILTPLPNKDLDETLEDRTLGELGLAPSSTLVLVPVRKFASAYEGGGAGTASSSGAATSSILGQLLALIVGLFTWIGGLLASVMGFNNASSATRAGSRPPVRAGMVNEAAARGTQLDDPRDDQQLYNGNSLNFEPRPDEDEETDDG